MKHRILAIFCWRVPSDAAPGDGDGRAGDGDPLKGGKLIALTFDDGPGPYTRRLLEGLAKRGVKATFFMLGQQAENYDVTARPRP